MKRTAKTLSEKAQLVLLGAICGDIIGSTYEFDSTKDYNFELFTRESRFTDDTVCSVALADALVSGKDFAEVMHRWCRKYRKVGYGGRFRSWIDSDTPHPYESWGNGSAMRVSAAGAIATSLDEAMTLAKMSAEVTHNHPEGVKGAQSTAVAIYFALRGMGKEAIKEIIEAGFGYDLSRSYNVVKAGYRFEVSCQKSVPEAMLAFLDSTGYESTIRKAVALGGDSDTQGAIAGAIAAAYYGEIPATILNRCVDMLPDDMQEVIEVFNHKLKEIHG